LEKTTMKKMSALKLTLLACALVTSHAFAQNQYCGTGANPVNIVFNGVGASAQTNSLAQAARALTQVSGNYNLVSTNKGALVTDTRPSTGAVSDTATVFWVIWDQSCNVYAFWTTDSGVGVKDFLAYQSFTNSSGKIYKSLAAAYGTITISQISSKTENQVGGLPDTQDSEVNTSGSDFQLIVAALNNNPQSRVATGVVAPPAYCGNLNTTTSGYLTDTQCYFNEAATDLRPEDALYATTRALTSYSGLTIAANSGGTANTVTKVGSGELTGLGYNTATGTISGCTPNANVGCTIEDSFSQSKTFNVVNFKLSGNDPLAGGTIPTYTALTAGAGPEVVIVHNGSDFGTTSDSGSYIYNNINKQTLSQVFSGWTHCANDLLTTGASFTNPGNPIQVVQREPLSGSYNVFEFNAVRTLAGSATSLVTTPPPPSNANDGQEQFIDPAALPGGNGNACTYNAGGYPQDNCFNPLFFSNPVNECPGTVGSNIPVRLRAIGTGEEVKATIGTYNSGAGSATIDNGIGYAFWGYGNLDPLCSGATTAATTSCNGTYVGHYLTVDGIDPFFITAGGQYDPTPNPAGAFNPPYCNITGQSQACFPIPFTHIYDGTYPIWTMVRSVTFAPSSGKVATPIGVLNIVAEQEIQSGPTGDGLSDFVPFLNTVSGNTATGVWTGNLNLFVFREHYKQSNISPANGHKGCNVSGSPEQSFQGIQLEGGVKGGPATCLVDAGGDVGGTVIPVQKDVDFYTDYATEEYGQHQ
jgi:hypothetical protein